MTEVAAVPRAWIGPRPNLVQASAVMFVGTTGIMIAGLPLLLSSLGADRLTDPEIGLAATAELLFMGIAAALAGALLPPHRLPLIAAVAALALAAIDWGTLGASHWGFIAMRAAAGVPSGLLMWIAIAFIARAPTPERWSGIFLAVQTLAQCLLSEGLTVAGANADDGFASLACLSLVTAGVAFALPKGFAPLTSGDDEAAAGLPPARGWLALGACFLYLAFIIGVWVYAPPLSEQAGHTPDVAGSAESISLAFQVLGSLVATLIAGHVRWFPVLSLSSLAFFALLAALASLPGPTAFLVLEAAFGFVWLFATPFLVPMTIEADPSRGAAVLLGGAQLIGGSLGPLGAAQFVTEGEARGALAFGAACLLVAVLIVCGLHLSRHRGLAAAPLPSP